MLNETESLSVQEAIDFAIMAHEGQVDKQGAPYFLHILRVSAAGKTPEEQMVGALHDVIEDTRFTEVNLRARFVPVIVEAVVVLTHKKGEPYSEYVARCAKNSLAKAVKKYDLIDHLNTNHLLPPAMANPMRKKYTAALRKLNGEGN